MYAGSVGHGDSGRRRSVKRFIAGIQELSVYKKDRFLPMQTDFGRRCFRISFFIVFSYAPMGFLHQRVRQCEDGREIPEFFGGGRSLTEETHGLPGRRIRALWTAHNRETSLSREGVFRVKEESLPPWKRI